MTISPQDPLGPCLYCPAAAAPATSFGHQICTDCQARLEHARPWVAILSVMGLIAVIIAVAAYHPDWWLR
jgi:hypothetical protein